MNGEQFVSKVIVEMLSWMRTRMRWIKQSLEDVATCITRKLGKLKVEILLAQNISLN